jgi:hypothetical protein
VIAFRDVSKVFTIPHLRRRTVFRRLFAAGRFSYETSRPRGISFEVSAGVRRRPGAERSETTLLASPGSTT